MSFQSESQVSLACSDCNGNEKFKYDEQLGEIAVTTRGSAEGFLILNAPRETRHWELEGSH